MTEDDRGPRIPETKMILQNGWHLHGANLYGTLFTCKSALMPDFSWSCLITEGCVYRCIPWYTSFYQLWIYCDFTVTLAIIGGQNHLRRLRQEHILLHPPFFGPADAGSRHASSGEPAATGKGNMFSPQGTSEPKQWELTRSPSIVMLSWITAI